MRSMRSLVFSLFFPFWIFLFFSKFASGLFYSLLAPFGESFFPLWIVGLLIGGSSIIQLLLDVPAGHALDRFGYRRLLKFSILFFLAAPLFLWLGFTPLTFVVSIALTTIGWLLKGPGVDAYVLSHADRRAAGRFISLRDVFGSLGTVFASASLTFVLTLQTKNIGFLLFALFAISFILIGLSPKDTVLAHAEKKLPTHHFYIRRHFLTETLKAMKKLNPASTMLAACGFASSTFYGVIWFVVPLLIAHAQGTAWLGIGLGIFYFAIVTLGFLLGSLADRWNKRTLVFLGLLLFAVSGMLLGFHFGWLFLLFGFLATSGDEMAGISLWSWLHALDHEHDNDGKVAGVITLFQDVGWAVGPIAAGILFGLIGPSFTILLGAVPICVTWILYQWLMRHHALAISGVVVPQKPHRYRHHG